MNILCTFRISAYPYHGYGTRVPKRTKKNPPRNQSQQLKFYQRNKPLVSPPVRYAGPMLNRRREKLSKWTKEQGN